MKYKLIREKNIVCCNCNWPISQLDTDNSLYMDVAGGKRIHWNCDDAVVGDETLYTLIDEGDLIIATSEDKLSLKKCDELFMIPCYNCQNGCPCCGGYGWTWNPIEEIEVSVELEDEFKKTDEIYVDESGSGNYYEHLKRFKLSEGYLILKNTK